MDNYKIIDDLVKAYQEGDEQSAASLLDMFDSYTKKYLHLIKYGRININDKDIIKFISLFSSGNSGIQNYCGGPVNPKVAEQIYNKVKSISVRCKNIGYEDLEQEMKIIVLSLASRYEKENDNINFCGYLYKSFPFWLFRRIKQDSKDPLVFYGDSLVQINPTNSITFNASSDYSEVYQDLDIADEYDLSENWINGLMCDRAFLALTSEERLILKCSYIENMSDMEISKQMNLSRRIIQHRRQKAEDVLAKELGEQFVEILKRKRNRKKRS